jgi:hypothetical protein
MRLTWRADSFVRSRIIRSHESRFQIIGGIAGDPGPGLGGGIANALTIGLRPSAGHADGKSVRSGQLAGNAAEMRRELSVVQQPQVRRAAFPAQ